MSGEITIEQHFAIERMDSYRRTQRVLEAVRTNPGATVAEIAAAVGLEATSLYRPVRDLASAGTVIKRGRGLFPAE